MNTTNCVYCDNVYEHMKGKLVIDVKAPDDEVIPTRVTISEMDGLFSVSLLSGSTLIYDVKNEMKICARIGGGKKEKIYPVVINPEEFTHLMVEYDYYYYQNQMRVEGVKLKKLSHKTAEDLYKV